MSIDTTNAVDEVTRFRALLDHWTARAYRESGSTTAQEDVVAFRQSVGLPAAPDATRRRVHSLRYAVTGTVQFDISAQDRESVTRYAQEYREFNQTRQRVHYGSFHPTDSGEALEYLDPDTTEWVSADAYWASLESPTLDTPSLSLEELRARTREFAIAQVRANPGWCGGEDCYPTAFAELGIGDPPRWTNTTFSVPVTGTREVTVRHLADDTPEQVAEQVGNTLKMMGSASAPYISEAKFGEPVRQESQDWN